MPTLTTASSSCAPSDVDEPTPEEETIEEAIEDPDELLDAS